MSSTYSLAAVRIALPLRSPTKLIPRETLMSPTPLWFPTLTLCLMSPPWAPTPGIKNGYSGAISRIRDNSSGAVAPTTRPTLSLVFKSFPKCATVS